MRKQAPFLPSACPCVPRVAIPADFPAHTAPCLSCTKCGSLNVLHKSYLCTCVTLSALTSSSYSRNRLLSCVGRHTRHALITSNPGYSLKIIIISIVQAYSPGQNHVLFFVQLQ